MNDYVWLFFIFFLFWLWSTLELLDRALYKLSFIIIYYCCRSVIKEFVHAFSCAYIELWMHLRIYGSTQNARVAPRATLTHFSCSPKFLRASLTRYTHTEHEQILKWSSSFVAFESEPFRAYFPPKLHVGAKMNLKPGMNTFAPDLFIYLVKLPKIILIWKAWGIHVKNRK